ncbi:MAG: hypothetical protein N3A53_02560 [Verrucomicrobiae bacterium]|nr:hypothetical protein [Verrucomicrobiae bacterium]
MHAVDWWLVVIPVMAFLVIGWWARRFMQSVADFLAGGRVAGRYLLTVAEGMGNIGLISVVAMMEQTYKSGLAIGYWGAIAVPVSLIMTLQAL